MFDNVANEVWTRNARLPAPQCGPGGAAWACIPDDMWEGEIADHVEEMVWGTSDD